MNITTAIALWGAATGTTAIVWDFIKWKTDGPRLKVSANPNMQVFDHAEGRVDPQQWIQVCVVNAGNRPATVTTLVGWPFRNRFHRLFGKPAGAPFLVMKHELGVPLPVTLAPSDEWRGFIDQENALKVAGGAILYCGVEHTRAKKPVLARIDPKTLRPPTAPEKPGGGQAGPGTGTL